eukprot:5702052-Prymnesium_polylepis.1
MAEGQKSPARTSAPVDLPSGIEPKTSAGRKQRQMLHQRLSGHPQGNHHHRAVFGSISDGVQSLHPSSEVSVLELEKRPAPQRIGCGVPRGQKLPAGCEQEIEREIFALTVCNAESVRSNGSSYARLCPCRRRRAEVARGAFARTTKGRNER